MAGRKPKGDKPMTPAERQRASREATRQRLAAEHVADAPIKKPKEPKPKPPVIQKAQLPPVAVKVRKPRSDSVTSAVSAMVSVDKEAIMPPAHTPLSESAMPFWHGIMLSRARQDWTESDLISAAQLAQCQLDISLEDAELREEGTIIRDYLGKMITNPRVGVVDMLVKRSMALMRTLRMGGKSAGDPRDLVGGRTIEGQARRVKGEIDDDDLLA